MVVSAPARGHQMGARALLRPLASAGCVGVQRAPTDAAEIGVATRTRVLGCYDIDARQLVVCGAAMSHARVCAAAAQSDCLTAKPVTRKSRAR